MSVKALLLMMGFAVIAGNPAVAQTVPPRVGDQIGPPPIRVRAPIEIHPGRLLYRRCIGWYELQYRPSGTVLYPGKHCWWVRG